MSDPRTVRYCERHETVGTHLHGNTSDESCRWEEFELHPVGTQEKLDKGGYCHEPCCDPLDLSPETLKAQYRGSF